MPVYNASRYLERSILSVLKQSYKDFQFIIIDDGSTDHSFEICQNYASKDKRILLLHQENQGVSTARNTGLKYVKGEILVFIDADDALCEGALEQIEKEMSAHNYDLFIYSWNIFTDGKKESVIIDEDDSSLNYVYKSIIEDDFKCGGGYPWNKAWRVHSIMMDHGQLPVFDKLELYEDKLWTFKCLDQIDHAKIGYSTKPLYNYYFRSGSLSHANTKSDLKNMSISSIECVSKMRDYVISIHPNFEPIFHKDLNIRMMHALFFDVKYKMWDRTSDLYYKKLEVTTNSVKDFLKYLIVVMYKKFH